MKQELCTLEDGIILEQKLLAFTLHEFYTLIP